MIIWTRRQLAKVLERVFQPEGVWVTGIKVE
jgi:hypothetical protein